MKRTSERFYDRLTAFYPLIDFFLKAGKQKFIEMVNAEPPGRLLEIGVGDGSHLKHYSGHHIVGIDTSERMLARATKHRLRNIELIKMDAEALSFADRTFDYVVLAHVIAVVDDPVKVLTEAGRVLKPRGKVFILNHFTPDNSLKYLDRCAEKAARFFHFKSFFNIASLGYPEHFRLLTVQSTGPFSYFKILVYEKNV